MSTGGIGSVEPADQAIQDICDKIKPQVIKMDGRNFGKFKAVKYASQVVAGINYFVKVDVGGNEFLHLRIFEDLQGKLHLTSYQKNKTLSSPLSYF
ncbi:cystatin-A-like [Ascaphus truei]|uniref:cystatin-A-like n=1 Tax=Ascaphus truei TaxID=8439 RepID=UPI003F5A42EE